MPRFLLLILPALALLASCGSQPASQAASACELATVPSGAVFGVRDGVDIATYPTQHPNGFTGCQRVWHGARDRPEAMQVLATYYYDQGQVRRLVGQVPGGPAYDCRYPNGALDRAQSRNPGVCPDAASVDRLPVGAR